MAFVFFGGLLSILGEAYRRAMARNITAEQLIAGAQIIGAATAVEALINGAQTLSF